MKTQSLSGKWEFRKKDEVEWLLAQVPGGVHTDLLALGLLPDPFVGDNEKQVKWVAESDWEYHRQFSIDPELMDQTHIWLVCDGLDTLAAITLNGTQLGTTNNMFRQYRWDVKALLKTGENDLYIAFDSPVRFITAQQTIRSMPGVPHAIPGGPYLRKAPCHFGWDWGPQLPPIGIWKDIRLEGYEGACIEEIHLKQHHSEGLVTVEAQINTQIWDESPYLASIHLVTPDGQILESSAVITQEKTCVLQVDVHNPQLWWPNGYGSQPLYHIRVDLHQSDKLADQHEYQLGLRTIELRQEPDEWGRCFTFVVNGQAIFAKGSNWIPADSFPTRISNDNVEKLIRAAADTHQNMIRVWGGGFYEDEHFYDLCDRFGILVWQDFIFACSVYPLDDAAFLENLHNEVIENIRRLRHRASLALWCGNNEIEWGWVIWGWKGPEYEDMKIAYDQFFHHTLPSWCETEDPDHAYWPSSPSSNVLFEDPNGQTQGDSHYWDVWHGRKPFTAYRSQYPRFMSEFGFQSLPPLDTIRTYAEEADWNITSYIMEQHQKNENGNALMVSQMLDSFRLPKDFKSLVYLSLVLQAEGIRYGVEHWRRHPRQVSGILYWNLNDCWPVASWSSLDYYGRWKALHYAARRFYAPLLLSIEDNPPEMNVYVSSDLREPWEGSLRWSLETLAGEILQAGEEPVRALPCEAAPICQLDFSNAVTETNRRDIVFTAELRQGKQVLARQTAFFVPTKHLTLTDPGLTAQVKTDQQQVAIHVTAHSLARQVECTLEDIDVVFSDNYFDLPAGRSVEINAPLPAGWTESQIKNALRIRSIYDSYAHKQKEED